MPKVKSKDRSKRARREPPKALPVTLLSGFLGAGKTTLLQHILRSDHGLKIAVVVNDIGAVNVDAALIKKTHHLTKTSEKVISMQNGCICCTLRGDLLEELVRLSQLQQFDYIIIESSGISEPEQVAETFDARLAEQMGDMSAAGGAKLDDDMLKALEHIKKAGGLDKFARLDTTATVIDAFTMMNDFDTSDLLSNRRDDVTPEDERTVSDLMVDQIEFADVIILNKTDMVDNASKDRITTLIKCLNHRAKIIESSYGKVDVKQLVNTGLFNLEAAQTGYGWLQDLHDMTVREVNGRNVVTPKPETEEYNVNNFVYTRQRPFHPKRLFALLYDKFILQMEHPEDDEDEEDEEEENEEDMEQGDDEDEDMVIVDAETLPEDSVASASSPVSSPSRGSTAQTIPSPGASDHGEKEDVNMSDDPLDIPPKETVLENRRLRYPLFKRLFRSKGEFFLATRPHRAGDWSQAGAMLTITGGRPWFCTLPEEEYITGSEEVDALVKHDIAKGGEWGDRRQELVFIGEKLDRVALETMLDECLLNDAELQKWEAVMRDQTLLEDDRARAEALEDIFEDGFPDWPGDFEDDHDHAHHDHGHDHSNMSGLRSIRQHIREVD